MTHTGEALRLWKCAALAGLLILILNPATSFADCCSCDSVDGPFCDTSDDPNNLCGEGDSDFECEPLTAGVCVGNVCVPATPTSTPTATPTVTGTPPLKPAPAVSDRTAVLVAAALLLLGLLSVRRVAQNR